MNGRPLPAGTHVVSGYSRLRLGPIGHHVSDGPEEPPVLVLSVSEALVVIPFSSE